MLNDVTEEDYKLFFQITVNIFEDSYKALGDSEYYGFLYHASVKFLRHINTAEALMHGSTWRNLQDEDEYNYFDQSSILTLLRTSYENLVTIAYLFFEEKNETKLKLYKYRGYYNRLRFPIKITSTELEDKINEEKKIVVELEKELRELGVPKKHMDDWKPKGWFDLGVDCKLPITLCNNYKHWSSHTHTGFDSLMQINSSEANSIQTEKNRNSINYLFLCISLSFFIKNFVMVLDKLGCPDVKRYDLTEIEGFLKFIMLMEESITE
ncbi:DUF5677 domain-containing protein [Shewanella algae]|uniref:DUF5677 domain-containing protein n=1 Tax=Shewanella algae TaxID=38313 RepID=UPI001183F8A1|nr:DUF5677 domain-containing protein [Shewanella algae]TVP08477.1 hypothetical protein AYI73_01025 [Shewanella algae]